jgi:hypothetical protein
MRIDDGAGSCNQIGQNWTGPMESENIHPDSHVYSVLSEKRVRVASSGGDPPRAIRLGSTRSQSQLSADGVTYPSFYATVMSVPKKN